MGIREFWRWMLAALLSLAAGAAVGFWVSRQSYSAFVYQLLFCLAVPIVFGCWTRSFAVIVPALLFNFGLSVTVSCRAASWYKTIGADAQAMEDHSRRVLLIVCFCIVVAGASLIPVGIKRAADRLGRERPNS
jgi:hypothetical protein